MVTQTADGKIVFQFYRPGARSMVISGDFNGWQHSFHMTRARDGWWRAQIELAPGTYRFRYLADGEWYTDYAAFGVEPGLFGWNSVLKVDPPEPRQAAHVPDSREAVNVTDARKPAAAPSRRPRAVPLSPPIRIEPPSSAIAAPATGEPEAAPAPTVDSAAAAGPQRRVRRRPALAG
ncbi:MAG TPA: hypothetical protein PLT93_13650 [Phycisphaerae bacterium]|nr:hypothetical protein [Phycisphaerae bacterium]